MTPKNIGWQLIRSVTEVDDPVLAAATLDAKPSRAQDVSASQIGLLQILCAGTGTDNGTVTATIRMGKKSAGPAIKVCSVVMTMGTMAVNADPQTQLATTLTRYADTVVITDAWSSGVGKTDGDGGNGCTVIEFDGRGFDWIDVEVSNLTNVTKANFYLSYI
jgi:hypothetical protein